MMKWLLLLPLFLLAGCKLDFNDRDIFSDVREFDVTVTAEHCVFLGGEDFLFMNDGEFVFKTSQFQEQTLEYLPHIFKLDGSGDGNIFVENDSIYVYHFNTDGDGGKSFFITEYDFNGNEISTLPLEISNFLYMDDVNGEDSVFKLYKSGEYFILSTINNRNIIYKLKKGKLAPVDIPDSMRKRGGVTFLEDFSPGSESVYFFDFENNKLYVLNLKQERVSFINFNFESDEDSQLFLKNNADNIYRDREGNILLQIKFDYDSYSAWIERKFKDAELKGEDFVYGAGTGPNMSVFCFLSIDEFYLSKSGGR